MKMVLGGELIHQNQLFLLLGSPNWGRWLNAHNSLPTSWRLPCGLGERPRSWCLEHLGQLWWWFRPRALIWEGVSSIFWNQWKASWRGLDKIDRLEGGLGTSQVGMSSELQWPQMIGKYHQETCQERSKNTIFSMHGKLLVIPNRITFVCQSTSNWVPAAVATGISALFFVAAASLIGLADGGFGLRGCLVPATIIDIATWYLHFADVWFTGVYTLHQAHYSTHAHTHTHHWIFDYIAFFLTTSSEWTIVLNLHTMAETKRSVWQNLVEWFWWFFLCSFAFIDSARWILSFILGTCDCLSARKQAQHCKSSKTLNASPGSPPPIDPGLSGLLAGIACVAKIQQSTRKSANYLVL